MNRFNGDFRDSHVESRARAYRIGAGFAIILAVLVAAFAFMLVRTAHAQGRYVPRGLCTLSGMSASTDLTGCAATPVNSAGGIPTDATYAVICAYNQAVVYRDDGGSLSGTVGTGGQGIAAGACIGYPGTLSALRFIQATSGAVLGVSFYRGPL